MIDEPGYDAKNRGVPLRERTWRRPRPKYGIAGIVRILLVVSAVLSCSESSRPRMLIIGFDAATWETISPLIEQNTLPHLERLIETGCSGSLATFIPTASPAIWTTIATGQSPDKHGIAFRVMQLGEGSGVQEMLSALSSDERQVPALWNIFSRQGMRSAFICWWSTWPAEEVTGYIISDKLYDPKLKQAVFPPGLHRELKEAGVLDADLPPEQAREIKAVQSRFRAWRRGVEEGRIEWNGSAPDVTRYFQDLEEKLNAYRRIMTMDYRTEQITHYLIDKDPDLDVVAPYFWYSDICQHIFWKYWKPEGFSLDPNELEIFSTLVPSYYRFMDDVIGRIRKHIGNDVPVVVVSDHGMESYYTDRYINDLFDVETLLEDLEWLVRGDDGKPDYARSKAYVKASSRQMRLINVALDGREPGGRVHPKQQETVCRTLIAELGALRTVPTGVPLFKEVRILGDTEKSYKVGSFVYYVFEQADIALTINDNVAAIDSLMLRGKSIPLSRWNRWRPSVSGQHHNAPPGIVILNGPPFRRGFHLENARVHDILPTVLASLGLAIAEDLDGHVLEAAFAGSYLEANPVERVATYGPRARDEGTEKAVPSMDEELVEQLRAIGYIR